MPELQKSSVSGVPRRAHSRWFERVSIWLRDLLDRLQPSEDAVLVATAIIVGLGTGIGSIILRYLISGIAHIGYEWIPEHTSSLGKAYVVFVPALAGIVVGLLVYYFAREAKGHGVPEVMEAVALRGGRIRPIVAVVKALASAFTIGSGGSAGREGPIVQIGSGLGSTIGQMLHLSEDRVTNLVACGAAGGIAATFNAPIAGVLFALEVILGEFSVRYFSTVVISAVVAAVAGQSVFGDLPVFGVPVEYGVNSLWEFAFYPILGLLAGLVGVAYVRSLYWTEDLFDRWKGVPEWVKPAVGGGLLGILALAYPLVTGVVWEREPQIFNVGYEVVIDSALSSELLLGTVLALLFLKLIATGLTLGSGGSGGVFAPGLFMGAMLGTAFEIVVNSVFPDVAAPAGAYALVGMAAVFSASAHAPITGVLILFEMTGDYRIILPLMLTVVIATLFSRFMLNGESIYTLKLTRRGIRLQRGRDVDIMQGLTVAEAMQTPAPKIRASASLSELRDTLRTFQTRSLVVLNEHDHLCGMVTLSDLQKTYESLPKADGAMIKTMTVADICKRDVVTVRPEDVLWRAVRTMGARGIGALPVVSGGHIMGMIGRQDIMKAYNIAIERKVRDQHIAERIRLNALTGAHVIQLQVGSHSALIGQYIRDTRWPDKSLIASIQRGSKLIVPHGNTQIAVNDLLTFVAEPDVESILREICVNNVKASQKPEKPHSEEPLLPEIEEEIEELEDMLAAEYDEDAIAAVYDDDLSEELEEEIEELEDMLAAEYDDEDDPAPDEIDEAVD